MRSQPQTGSSSASFMPPAGVSSPLVFGALCGGWVWCRCIWWRRARGWGRFSQVPQENSQEVFYEAPDLQKQGGGASAPPGTPQTQQLPSGSLRPVPGSRFQVPGFLSRSGTPATCDSLGLALNCLWPLFIYIIFFQLVSSSFFFQILELDETVVLLSQGFLDVSEVRSQLLISEHGDSVSAVHCTDAGESPKLHKASLLSIRLRLKPPIGVGAETCKNHSFFFLEKKTSAPL